jgi:hypothetical protein
MATDVNLGMLSLEELRRLLGQSQGVTPSSQVGVSPYQQIMGRMPLLENPYASMSGGYNNFQGGYNPNMYSNAPRAIGQLGFGGGGSGGSEAAAPSAWSSMTPAEQAAYYAANPTMATITQLGQKAFGLTSMGALQRAMNPGFVSDQSLIAMGVNPAAYQAAKESFRASEIADMNGGFQSAMDAAESYGGASMAEQQAMNDAIAAQNDANQGAAVGEGQTSISDSASSAADGYGSGDSAGFGGGTDSGSDGWAKGGKVTKDRLKGPDPKGPDEGYGALLSGEYVIKKSAVKKYGAGLLDMINAGKIPAKKMKSLLG